MPDFPGISHVFPAGSLSTGGDESPCLDACIGMGAHVAGAAAWGVANRAIYAPVILQVAPVTVYKMAFLVGAQAGNYDIGIYDQQGKRLVSTGSTVVPAAGIAIVDITDTTLATPGIYYLALVCSTVTTLTIYRSAPGDVALRLTGMKTQDIGATTLPDPWTAVTTNATNQLPAITAAFRTTI
jgi:hypothetical protein